LVDAEPADVLNHALETTRTQINRLLESDGVNHVMIRSDLQAAMEAHANVFRSREGLLSALATIHECRRQYRDVSIADPSRIFNTDLIQTIETRNLIGIAEAIAIGAFVREEFCGAHWRVEYQERHDDEWLKHRCLHGMTALQRSTIVTCY
jgi:succinate dehydrogenase / fumarate reductase, flavoprotein subunit